MLSFFIRRLSCVLDLKKEKLDPIDIPQYEGLSIKDMLTFFQRYPKLRPYLPEDKEVWKLPKKWIADIGHTIIGAPFAKWVKT